MLFRSLEKEMMYHGALSAMMSGSGPTVFGIFATKEAQTEGYQAILEKKLAAQLFMTGFTKGV